jgi:hypothetical protein
VTQIARDIKYFMAILAVLVIGFSNAFYLTARTDLRGLDAAAACDGGSSLACAFGTVGQTLLSLFSAMTGGYDLTLFQGSTLVIPATAIYLGYVVLNTIILLNLLSKCSPWFLHASHVRRPGTHLTLLVVVLGVWLGLVCNA